MFDKKLLPRSSKSPSKERRVQRLFCFTRRRSACIKLFLLLSLTYVLYLTSSLDNLKSRVGLHKTPVTSRPWSSNDFKKQNHSWWTRPSAYKIHMFLNPTTQKPLYDLEPSPAKMISESIFPNVGVSLSARDKKKKIPLRRLGSILGPIPDTRVQPDPASLDTLFDVPDGPLEGHPPRLIPVTAILLSWKRLESLKLVVSHLKKYPYIREILIWNNNKENFISTSDFHDPEDIDVPSLVRVFNSEENIHDLAKYTTCSMASHSTCYFQDDDWLNTHIDSLYTTYLRNPHLIHSNTMPVIHLEHRRWMFASAKNPLHTGFTWLGCGSFVPKSMVQQFMSQIGWAGFHREKLRLADMYFSIWTNQYPVQLGNPLTPLDQGQSWSESVDQWAVVYKNTLEAAKILAETVTRDPENVGQDYFIREEAKPYLHERDARAPCHNDACIFLTSLDAFPHPSLIGFHLDNTTHMHDHEALFNAAGHPSTPFWEKHAYHNAVDGDKGTCWDSKKHPKIGDYFGLHFVMPLLYKKITVFSSRDINDYDRSVEISTSLDGISWKTCKLDRAQPGAQTSSIILEFDCGGTELFTFLKMVATRDFNEPFEICGFSLDGMDL